MPIKISRVIETKLRFLKLNRAGKIRLCVFSDKILYKALSLFQRNFDTIPENPFNTYFTLCLLEAQRLQLEADWNAMDDFPNFDQDGPVTLEDELFDMKLCHKIMHDWQQKKMRPKAKQFPLVNSRQPRGQYSPTFSQGLTYWKYGKEYPYPDQAIDENTNPTKKDPNWTPPLPQDHPSRLELNQEEELKKAIRSGGMSKKGLALLRETFAQTKPQLIPIIDAYISGEATPDDSQADIPF